MRVLVGVVAAVDVCVCVCVCVCVRACVRACVRVRARVRTCVRACVRACYTARTPPRRPRHPWPARAQQSRRARLCSQRRRLPTLGRAAAARGARRWKRVRTAACWVAARSRPQPAPPPAGRDAPCRRGGWTPWRQAGAAPSPRGAVQRRSRKTKRAANTDATRGRTTLAAGRLSSPPRRRPAARPDATPRAGGARPCARGCRSAARRTSPWSGARAPAPRWPHRAHRAPSRARCLLKLARRVNSINSQLLELPLEGRCRASPSSHRPRRPERRRPPP